MEGQSLRPWEKNGRGGLCISLAFLSVLFHRKSSPTVEPHAHIQMCKGCCALWVSPPSIPDRHEGQKSCQEESSLMSLPPRSAAFTRLCSLRPGLGLWPAGQNQLDSKWSLGRGPLITLQFGLLQWYVYSVSLTGVTVWGKGFGKCNCRWGKSVLTIASGHSSYTKESVRAAQRRLPSWKEQLTRSQGSPIKGLACPSPTAEVSTSSWKKTQCENHSGSPLRDFPAGIVPRCPIVCSVADWRDSPRWVGSSASSTKLSPHRQFPGIPPAPHPDTLPLVTSSRSFTVAYPACILSLSHHWDTFLWVSISSQPLRSTSNHTCWNVTFLYWAVVYPCWS